MKTILFCTLSIDTHHEIFDQLRHWARSLIDAVCVDYYELPLAKLRSDFTFPPSFSDISMVIICHEVEVNLCCAVLHYYLIDYREGRCLRMLKDCMQL
jgi:hypothetical protein